jgi:glyoxylase-like metal-dependent hydrolase (beta-lactamase superfamily II)
MEPSAGALGNESRGEVVLITGDVMHRPCQIPYPDWSASDTDPNQAQASRSNLIERFAESDTMIISTHFANPVAGGIRRDDTTFRLIPADN